MGLSLRKSCGDDEHTSGRERIRNAEVPSQVGPLMRTNRFISWIAAALLAAASATAQAPAPVPLAAFESWAPLGEYERAAFAEQGSLRIVIPTKLRNVEIAFTPQPLLDEDYGALEVDGRGTRTGVATPRFTAWGGHVESNSGRDFAKLSVSAVRGKLEGLLRIDGAFYALGANLAAGDYLLSVQEVTEDEIGALLKSCGVTEGELNAAATATPAAASSGGSPAVAAATALREIELGTEADALFVAQTGSASAANTRILSIVNMLNGIYETDLGLTNRVVTQRTHTGSDPYTTTDSSNLLDQFSDEFASHVFVGYDDAMLFSGRNFDGNTVGVAYLDATCQPWRFGIAQFLNQSDFYTSLIVAHELGHNLGANHTSDGIMAPAITGDAYFNQASKDEIAFYTNRVGCLGLASGSGSNTAPVLNPVGPQIVDEGQTLAIQLSATDVDGDAINYGATPLPQGASLSASGRFSWTPLRTAAGCAAWTETTVQFTASDGLLGANESVPITVIDVQTNAAPTLLDPADRSLYAGQSLQFQLQASDADGDSIAFSSNNLPAGASLSPGGAFSWTPSAAAAGTTNVTFVATDCTGRAASQSAQFGVSIQPAPHLTSLSKTAGWYGEVLTLSGVALSGNQLRVVFVNRDAAILSVADDSVSVLVPKVKKKYRKRGAQPVFLIRDGVQSDNTLSFDYVKP